MEAMGLPQGYDASEPGNIFEALSTDPDRLKLDAFLYGISHQHHLALERTRQTNTETAGKKIVSEIHNFLEEDVDLKDTHFMCIAGALSASLEVWCPKRTWNGENERVACFDGISIYKRDLNTLNDNSWVCDTIVDVLLRYYCKLAEKRNRRKTAEIIRMFHFKSGDVHT
ncbi:uncharacterized protein LOC124456180 [Xenia sp. Carnegie-2017]|uniref:uncharacterized protein LOC124456180 n=1 Tax=Xenia sp. Carnegie-2017 TaxID=2897299 RepID=UPI001F04A484|nr:uncharacterized protein LOC124456180 [Xenia sp. Carnegie-2017]